MKVRSFEETSVKKNLGSPPVREFNGNQNRNSTFSPDAGCTDGAAPGARPRRGLGQFGCRSRIRLSSRICCPLVRPVHADSGCSSAHSRPDYMREECLPLQVCRKATSPCSRATATCPSPRYDGAASSVGGPGPPHSRSMRALVLPPAGARDRRGHRGRRRQQPRHRYVP